MTPVSIIVPSTPPKKTVLLVQDNIARNGALAADLESAGLSVLRAGNGMDALQSLRHATPDLIVSDLDIPEMDGLELLGHVRSNGATRNIPIIFMGPSTRASDSVRSLTLGADDYMLTPFKNEELLARIKAKIERPSTQGDQLREDRPSGLLSNTAFLAELKTEQARTRHGACPSIVVKIYLKETGDLRARLGPQIDGQLARQMGEFLAERLQPLDLAARTTDGSFLLMLSGRTAAEASHELYDLSKILVNHRFWGNHAPVRVTPVVGYTELTSKGSAQEAVNRASLAADFAAPQLDLQPVQFKTAMLTLKPKLPRSKRVAAMLERLRLPVQVIATFALGWIIPFCLYWLTAPLSVDVSGIAYLALVTMMFVTAVSIWIEGVLSLHRIDPPSQPASPYPPATAIIAAYLPNEAATIIETLECFLKHEYPGTLQVILAYNTPQDLAIEAQLRAISAKDPRLVPLRVKDSHSKAQNINAALSLATGEFTGIFDADHHPDPGSFARAWRWLSTKADVVQGRCLIRNGDASWVAKMVAVEFEQIYAVSHPGRARMHDFGIFGGSNGYWKTDLLRQTRMHGFMLTEDIDSSLRVVEQGGQIVSDPWLISRELSPITFRCLVHQRLRWAQGWLQASVTEFVPLMRSDKLNLRQKLGVFHLLAWREVFPWISMQMVPLVAFWAIRAGGIFKLDWLIPIFVFFTLFIMSTGPGQLLFTYHNADPEIKKRKGWFVLYLFTSLFMFAALKNILARVAALKEVLKERAWRITSRNPFADIAPGDAPEGMQEGRQDSPSTHNGTLKPNGHLKTNSTVTVRSYSGPETRLNGSTSADAYPPPIANGLLPSTQPTPPPSPHA